MRTFWKRYEWQIGGILAISAALVMIRLGFWQLSRLEQRRAINAQIQQRMTGTPLEINDMLAYRDELEYQRGSVQGEFDHANEFLLKRRYLGGRPGYHLITPLRIRGSSKAVLIDRGWVPLDAEQPSYRQQLATTGQQHIRGLLRPSEPQPSGMQVGDPPISTSNPRNDQWFYLSIEQIQQQLPYPVLNLIVAQDGPAPPAGRYPVPMGVPLLDEGSHLSYVLQWFTFAAIVLGAYGGVLWKYKLRRR